MKITLYNGFSKKQNSTKIPSSTDDENSVVLDLELKENTSAENPVFVLEYGKRPSFNYCYWDGHYYFITDYTFISRNIYEVRCQRDYLASWRTHIGNSTQFVERCSNSSYYDDDIYDSAVSQSTLNHISTAASKLSDLIPIPTSSMGTYIIRIISSGGIRNYVVDSTDYHEIMELCYTGSETYPISSESISFISSEIIQSVFNPFDYILSVMWFPIKKSAFSNLVSTKLKLGWYTFTSKNFDMIGALSDVVINFNGTLTKPSLAYGDFRDTSSAWSRYDIFVPSIGATSLDPALINKTLYYNLAVDLVTGKSRFYVSTSAYTSGAVGDFYNYSHGQMGVPIQIGHTYTDMMKVTSSAINMASNIASGNVAASATSAISTVTDLVQPTKSVSGSAGSFCDIYLNAGLEDNAIICFANQKQSGQIPTNYVGRPTMKILKISDIGTGNFIKCGQATMDIGGYLVDKQQIESQMNSGFFYE